jgi:hypothetical protein
VKQFPINLSSKSDQTEQNSKKAEEKTSHIKRRQKIELKSRRNRSRKKSEISISAPVETEKAEKAKN